MTFFLRGFFIDEKVTWIDPRAPKQGYQLAVVLDVAGHWVLIRATMGTREGQTAWVHKSKLNHTRDPQPMADLLEAVRIRGIQENRDHAARGISQGKPEEPWGIRCIVCFGVLQQVRPGNTRAVLKTWLYCPACDRMQRHQDRLVQRQGPQRVKAMKPPPGGPEPAAQSQEGPPS